VVRSETAGGLYGGSLVSLRETRAVEAVTVSAFSAPSAALPFAALRAGSTAAVSTAASSTALPPYRSSSSGMRPA